MTALTCRGGAACPPVPGAACPPCCGAATVTRVDEGGGVGLTGGAGIAIGISSLSGSGATGGRTTARTEGCGFMADAS